MVSTRTAWQTSRRRAVVVAARYRERGLRTAGVSDVLTTRLSHLYLASTKLRWNSTVPTDRIEAMADAAA